MEVASISFIFILFASIAGSFGDKYLLVKLNHHQSPGWKKTLPIAAPKGIRRLGESENYHFYQFCRYEISDSIWLV